MRVTALGITDLRIIESLRLSAGPGLNVLIGPNGAGKTSVLEALYVLSRGHSFRRRVRDGLIRHGAEAFVVRAALETTEGAARTLALRRSRGGWEGRIDERPMVRLGDLFGAFAACAFTPGSHELIDGGAEERRAFWDWGLFHVEPEFLETWRRYARALRQRNALLRDGGEDSELEAFEEAMAVTGERIAGWRALYLAELAIHAKTRAAALLPELGRLSLTSSPGYEAGEGASLARELAMRRAADRIRGATSVGPHRADWRIRFGERLGPAELSRGQLKLAALALVLAQVDLHARRRGDWPVLLLDDLASELDEAHQEALLRSLEATPVQVFLTGTALTGPLAERRAVLTLFHVEQGRIVRAAPAE